MGAACSGCRLVSFSSSFTFAVGAAIYFCIKLQFGQRALWAAGQLHSFSTIYTDIIMINNAQTCHTLVSCVFDWSALGARLVMIGH